MTGEGGGSRGGENVRGVRCRLRGLGNGLGVKEREAGSRFQDGIDRGNRVGGKMGSS